MVIEVGHAAVQAALTRSTAPATGRAEALRLRPRVALLRAVERQRVAAPVALAERVSALAMLDRKLADRRLIRRAVAKVHQ
jgi:hypothetical protein